MFAAYSVKARKSFKLETRYSIQRNTQKKLVIMSLVQAYHMSFCVC